MVEVRVGRVIYIVYVVGHFRLLEIRRRKKDEHAGRRAVDLTGAGAISNILNIEESSRLNDHNDLMKGS